MKIYVCIKQVPDTETKIKIGADGKSIDTQGIKWIISPYDEFAIEEALRWKEKNAGATVTVLSAGPARVTEALRTALAMGCDEAVHLDLPESSDATTCGLALGKYLQKQGDAKVVFCGKEAIDDSASTVGTWISEVTGFSCINVVLNLELQGGNVVAKREVEGGTLEVIQASLPVVITTQKGLNEPRYASLPNIMKAKKKTIPTVPSSELISSEEGLSYTITQLELPPAKKAGKVLQGDLSAQAAELAKLLKEEAKVI